MTSVLQSEDCFTQHLWLAPWGLSEYRRNCKNCVWPNLDKTNHFSLNILTTLEHLRNIGDSNESYCKILTMNCIFKGASVAFNEQLLSTLGCVLLCQNLSLFWKKRLRLFTVQYYTTFHSHTQSSRLKHVWQ